MKVESSYWPNDASAMYRSVSQGKTGKTEEQQTKEKNTGTKTDEMTASLEKLKEMAVKSSQNADSSQSSSKMKASSPDESVGELAAMLARAETRMDVQQVASKAMRALTNLKMASAASEGKEAKKIARMIKRMEKLIKRIQKKMQHLSKEEQIENQQRRAEKKMDMEKAKELAEELKTRRNKRHKDERRYALKELAEDGKNETNEMVSSMISASSAGLSSSPDFSAMTGMDMSVSMEGASFDMMV